MAQIADRLMSIALSIPHRMLKKERHWLFMVQQKTRFNGNLRALCDAAVADPRITSVLIDYRGIEPVETIRSLYANAGNKVRIGKGPGFLASKLSADVLLVNALQCFGLPVFSVNLWHGIPLKGINLLSGKNGSAALTVPFFNRYGLHDRLIASSPTDAETMAKCFGISKDRVIVSGLPRNDWLKMPVLPADLQRQERQLLALCAGRKLVLYAPTFRDEDRSFVAMTGDELSTLAHRIAGQGGVLGWRPHYLMRNIALPPDLPVLDLGASHFPEVQVILRNSACLITDYSSIALDFMLLERPAFCFARDHDRFSRGFLYDLRAVFPGQFHEDHAMLSVAVERVLADPAFASEVAVMGKRLLPLFHTAQSGRSCAALIDHLLVSDPPDQRPQA
jgi:CDP-glycerol glycerophosphotransferase (TagB/SpsB family)